MKKILFLTVPVLLTLALSSCKIQNLFDYSSNKKHVTNKDTIFKKNIFPDKGDRLIFNTNPNYQYTIRKDDKINLSILNHDDLSVGSIYSIYNSNEGYGKWLLVDNNGEVTLPEIGNIKLEGETILEAKESLKKELSKKIVNPIIDIKVLNKSVIILGEVKTPGKILLEREINTLIEIIAQAGDFDQYGNKAKVKIIRKVNDKDYSVEVDLTNMETYAQNNIQIHPGDIIYIPAKKRKAWDKGASSIIIPTASAITAAALIFKTFF
ncbi:MAG: polysaccharide biosynthesis/export family protein [Chitinophagaceae bacterium]|nr:polysaccharide biosynthesis/export family protein [Chitinophagaceae bacterium]